MADNKTAGNSTQNNRRNFLKAAGGTSVGLAAMVGCGGGGQSPGINGAPGSNAGNPNDLPDAPFQHAVASGDPTSNSIILWTRLTLDNPPAAAQLSWMIADNQAFTGAMTGTSLATAVGDYTSKVRVSGLTAGTTYYYKFTYDGVDSVVARTKTLPANPSDIRIGLVSCASIPHGYFHAYRRLAEFADDATKDVTAIIHLGDYIYEYPGVDAGAEDPVDYGNADVIAQGRTYSADNQVEIVELEDYRKRHANYKLDEDLQALHLQYPFFTIWDDHEIADNTYDADEGGLGGGAFNHQTAAGDDANGSNCPSNQLSVADCWQARKRNAFQAYLEWMPIDNIGESRGTLDAPRLDRSRRIGSLMDLSFLDTRASGRDEQLGDFHQGSTDANRKMISQTQEDGLIGASGRLQTAEDDGVVWKVVAQQVILSPTQVSPATANALANAPADAGIPVPDVVPSVTTFQNGDAWDAYTVQQGKIIDKLASVKNCVVLTGDVHTSWAFEVVKSAGSACDVAGNCTPAAVEFVCPSITSPGIDDSTQARTLETGLQQANPHLKYVNLDRRGFAVMSISTTEFKYEWFHIDHAAHQGPTDNSLTLVSTATVAAKTGADTGTSNLVMS